MACMDRVLIDSFLLFDGIFLCMIYFFFYKWSSVLISLNRNSHPFTYFQRLNVFAQQKWQTKFHQKLKNKIKKRCCQAFYISRNCWLPSICFACLCIISWFFEFLSQGPAVYYMFHAECWDRSGNRTDKTKIDCSYHLYVWFTNIPSWCSRI